MDHLHEPAWIHGRRAGLVAFRERAGYRAADRGGSESTDNEAEPVAHGVTSFLVWPLLTKQSPRGMPVLSPADQSASKGKILRPRGRRVSDWSGSPIVARLARHLGLLIEYRRWTHCGIESVANLRKRLADYTHSAHRLLA
jgi:hypothetical protein